METLTLCSHTHFLTNILLFTFWSQRWGTRLTFLRRQDNTVSLLVQHFVSFTFQSRSNLPVSEQLLLFEALISLMSITMSEPELAGVS